MRLHLRYMPLTTTMPPNRGIEPEEEKEEGHEAILD